MQSIPIQPEPEPEPEDTDSEIKLPEPHHHKVVRGLVITCVIIFVLAVVVSCVRISRQSHGQEEQGAVSSLPP